MTETAVGPLTYEVLSMRRMLCESPAFLRWLGVHNEAEARKRIHLFHYEFDSSKELHQNRPFAVIWPSDKLDFEAVSWGAVNYLDPAGSVTLLLTDIDRYPTDRNRSGLDFTGWVDQVLKDIRDHAGDDDRLPIQRIALLQRPAHSPPQDDAAAGPYWHRAFMFAWGGNSRS